MNIQKQFIYTKKVLFGRPMNIQHIYLFLL